MGAYAGFTRFYGDPAYPALIKVEDETAPTVEEANERLSSCTNMNDGSTASCSDELAATFTAADAAKFFADWDSACEGKPTEEEKAVMKRLGVADAK